MIRKHRFDRGNTPTTLNWKRPEGPQADQLAANATLDCGWGRLIFAHTFESESELARKLCAEKAGS